MKNKNALKKSAIKLDLEKIEIDVLSDSMLNGLQGGYQTQPFNTLCLGCETIDTACCTNGCTTLCTKVIC
jgi:hypothetical protein